MQANFLTGGSSRFWFWARSYISIIDQEKASAFGLLNVWYQCDFQAVLGAGRYVYDSFDRGRVKTVYMQGEAEWSFFILKIWQHWYVRGQWQYEWRRFLLLLLKAEWTYGPKAERFTVWRLMKSKVLGKQVWVSVRPWTSLTACFWFYVWCVMGSWSGLSYQERLSKWSNAKHCNAISILVGFLCLAAL